MASKKPITKLNEITQAINAILEESIAYLPKDSLPMRRLQRESDDLIKVNAAQGWIVKARLAQLQGDEEIFRYAVDNAQRLDHSGEWEQTKGVGLLNLHRYSEAQEILARNLAPQLGWFSQIYAFALYTGAYLAVAKNAQALRSKGIEMPEDFPTNTVAEVSDFMTGAGVTDQDVAHLLDVAGFILKKHSYMPAASNPYPSLVWVDSERLLHFKFPLQLTPANVAKFNVELADAMAGTESDIINKVHISFGVAA